MLMILSSAEVSSWGAGAAGSAAAGGAAGAGPRGCRRAGSGCFHQRFQSHRQFSWPCLVSHVDKPHCLPLRHISPAPQADNVCRNRRAHTGDRRRDRRRNGRQSACRAAGKSHRPAQTRRENAAHALLLRQHADERHCLYHGHRAGQRGHETA